MDIKGMLTSKTIWGLLFAVATPIAAKHGFVVNEGTAADVVTLLGGALAFWGRLTAQKPLVGPSA